MVYAGFRDLGFVFIARAVFEAEDAAWTDGGTDAATDAGCADDVFAALGVVAHVDTHFAVHGAVAAGDALVTVDGNAEARKELLLDAEDGGEGAAEAAPHTASHNGIEAHADDAGKDAPDKEAIPLSHGPGIDEEDFAIGGEEVVDQHDGEEQGYGCEEDARIACELLSLGEEEPCGGQRYDQQTEYDEGARRKPVLTCAEVRFDHADRHSHGYDEDAVDEVSLDLPGAKAFTGEMAKGVAGGLGKTSTAAHPRTKPALAKPIGQVGGKDKNHGQPPKEHPFAEEACP